MRTYSAALAVAGLALALGWVLPMLSTALLSPEAGKCAPGATEAVWLPDPSAPPGHRQLLVHRPPGPDRADLPTLYVLHGYPGGLRDYFDDLAVRLDAQMCRTGVPFVLAGPDGTACTLDTEWGDDAGGRFALETFVTGQVIAATEGDLRRPRSLRSIGGFSMGGYGASALALRHPDLYSEVISFGGYFRLDDPDDVFAGDDIHHAPDRMVGPGVAGQLRFYLVEGAQEETPLQTGSIRGEADRFAAILRRDGVQMTDVHPPGGHGPDGWYPALPGGVDFLTAGWRRLS
jgi:S-formylglutathione hydrolase FrmB